VVAARRRDHAGCGHLARQEICEGAARLERTGVLEQLQFQGETRSLEAEIRAVDFDERGAANMGPYD